MNKELVDTIANLPADGPRGVVGHKTAEAVVAAVEASKAKPVEKVSIETPKPKVWVDDSKKYPEPAAFVSRPPDPKPHHRPKGKG